MTRTATVLGGAGAIALIGGGAWLLLKPKPADEAIPLGQVGSGNPFFDFFGGGFPQGSTETEGNPFSFPDPPQPLESFYFEETVSPSVANSTFTTDTAEFFDFGQRDFVPSPTSGGSGGGGAFVPLGTQGLIDAIVSDTQIKKQEREQFNALLSDATTPSQREFMLQTALDSKARSVGDWNTSRSAKRRVESAEKGFLFGDNAKKERSYGSPITSTSPTVQNTIETSASEVGVVSRAVQSSLQRDRLASLASQMARNKNEKSKKSGAEE